MDTLGLGVVGLGMHAQRGHIDHLHSVPEAQLVAVCDPDPQSRAQQLTDGVTAYAELEPMLADERVQAVIVCSPDRFHAATLHDAVAANKHVLIDKPLADRSEQLPAVADDLRLAHQQGLVVSSCHPRRFDPPFTWLHSQLPALGDRLGAVLDVRFDFFYQVLRRRGLHTGLLMDHVNHEIDLVDFLFGRCPLVAHRLIDREERYGVAGQRADGIALSFFGSRHLQRPAYAELLRVRFERGEVTVNADSGQATVYDLQDNVTYQLACGATDYQARFHAVNANFCRAALGLEPSYLSAEQLLLNTAIGIMLTETGSFDSLRVFDSAAES